MCVHLPSVERHLQQKCSSLTELPAGQEPQSGPRLRQIGHLRAACRKRFILSILLLFGAEILVAFVVSSSDFRELDRPTGSLSCFTA